MAEISTEGGVVDLWAGWSVNLPPSHYQRNEDGSWSAWGSDWVIDVHIIEIGGDSDSNPVSGERILGDREQQTKISGKGWVGYSEILVEKDGLNDVFRLAGTLGAKNTLMSCWVSYFSEQQLSFARALIDGVAHHEQIAA